MSRNNDYDMSTSWQEFQDSQSVCVNIKSIPIKNEENENGFHLNRNISNDCNQLQTCDKGQLLIENPFVRPSSHGDVSWQWRKLFQASKSDIESVNHVSRLLPCNKCCSVRNNDNSNDIVKRRPRARTIFGNIVPSQILCQTPIGKGKGNGNGNGKQRDFENKNDTSYDYQLLDMLAKNLIKFGCPRHDLYHILQSDFHYYCNNHKFTSFIFCNGYSTKCVESHPMLKKIQAKHENDGKRNEMQHMESKNTSQNESSSGRWFNIRGEGKHLCLNRQDGGDATLCEYKRWSLYDIGAKIDQNITIDVRYDYLDIGASKKLQQDKTQNLKCTTSILLNRAANTPFIKKMRPGLWKYTKHLQCFGSWFGGKLFYARENDVNVFEIIPHTFYLGIKLYSPFIDKSNNTNQQRKIDCLDDIAGAIGLTYTCSSESGDSKDNKNESIKGTVTNCVLLRCNGGDLEDTLKKCFMVGYFRKWGKDENIEIPPANS